MIPSKVYEARAYTTMLEDQELLTITQLILNLEHNKDLVDSVLSGNKDGEEDGNSNGIGADDRDRDNASILKRRRR